jgi:quercetin dioxygenase-like cupin family protein
MPQPGPARMNKDPDPCERHTARTVGVHSGPQGTSRPLLRQSLLDRVNASARAHAEYCTVRRQATPWVTVGDGVRQRWLRQGPAESVALFELDDGAPVPEAPQAVAVEDLLAHGGLIDPASGCELLAWSHSVRLASVPSALRSRGTSTLYRRMLLQPISGRPAAEARWWQAQLERTAGAKDTGGWCSPRRWVTSHAGVTVLPLATHRHVVSMLVRFEAGAGVPDHGHDIDEDCLVLEGDMFLGDILLQPGDYQLAPAGGTHFGETTDSGVLFYFHGALDSALLSSRGQ